MSSLNLLIEVIIGWDCLVDMYWIEMHLQVKVIQDMVAIHCYHEERSDKYGTVKRQVHQINGSIESSDQFKHQITWNIESIEKSNRIASVILVSEWVRLSYCFTCCRCTAPTSCRQTRTWARWSRTSTTTASSPFKRRRRASKSTIDSILPFLLE